jgi:hypothetical protein
MLRSNIRALCAHRFSAVAFVALASPGFTGCAATRAELVQMPSSGDAVEVREQFAATHRPILVRPASPSTPGLTGNTIAPYAVLANGVRVEEPRAVRALVDEGSATARALDSAAEHQQTAEALRLAGTLGVLAGFSSAVLGMNSVTDSVVAGRPISDQQWLISSAAFLGGVVVQGAGIVALLIGNDEERAQIVEQETALVTLESDMRSRLRLPAATTSVASVEIITAPATAKIAVDTAP